MTPGTREKNDGNWRTAARWSEMLRDRFRVILQTAWSGEPADALIALHARRSAESIRAFRDRNPHGRIALVLTGTDLYGDLPGNKEAVRSLDIADRVIVLQEDALDHLRAAWRKKSAVIYQSATPLRPASKAKGRLDCVAVGHLREEKDPETLFRALSLLPSSLPIRVRHIGAALDPRLAKLARSTAKHDPRYRWFGPLAHGLTRIAIRNAHVLVHPSRLEGGANVIAEALASGSTVIASRMSGNVGMLGRDYPGFFPVGEPAELADRLAQALDPAYLRELTRACRKRAPLFRPEHEARQLGRILSSLLA
ncbi:hypothetical protein DSM104440_01405 [Usitatibacter palustris]|uniref:Glycosyl transferase family 1 domain-containing protein n=1 Tax=Usitatibacter palustris TaxID=2732487 RepID=A0A6M4H7D3_9PROT|nr:hypothetical protein DSM104440_01405 [Usitatibacter palustris]